MFEEEIEQLGTFYRMPGNWNHNGANTIGFDAILRTMEVMTAVYCEFARKPFFICPTAIGGVSVEYEYDDAKIEIEIYDAVSYYSYLIDLGEIASSEERYFIETEVDLPTLIYRIGQIIGPLQEEGDEEIHQMELDRVEELQSQEDPIHPKKIWVTGKDYDILMQGLKNPSEANENLLKAMRNYEAKIESGELVTDHSLPDWFGKEEGNVEDE